jgi:Leucine-rich repeat (LRR) protein
MALYNPPANNPYALTKVKYLSIYYCKIESLRDMGTGWSNLIQLSVYFGSLKDLSGLNAFPSLEYLNCPFNSISTISDLMFHSTMVSVDF